MYSMQDVVLHRPPMLLVDELLKYDSESASCRVTISPQSAFFDPVTQVVPNYIAVEYMAQTIAAFAGAQDRDAGRDIQAGFLLGTRKLTMATRGFAAGNALTINAKRIYQEASGLSVFECDVVSGNDVLVTANVNVFQPENARGYVAQQTHSKEQG